MTDTPAGTPADPMPTRALIDEVLADQGLHWDEERRASGLAQTAQLRPALLALRAKPLAYVGDVLEPAHALRWLDATGEARP